VGRQYQVTFEDVFSSAHACFPFAQMHSNYAFSSYGKLEKYPESILPPALYFSYVLSWKMLFRVFSEMGEPRN
jgi:hypothetical protein